jgi:hypothetical protein
MRHDLFVAIKDLGLLLFLAFALLVLVLASGCATSQPQPGPGPQQTGMRLPRCNFNVSVYGSVPRPGLNCSLSN